MNMRKNTIYPQRNNADNPTLGIHAQQQAKDSTVNRTVVVEPGIYPRYSGCIQNKTCSPKWKRRLPIKRLWNTM